MPEKTFHEKSIRFYYNKTTEEHLFGYESKEELLLAPSIFALDCLQDIIAEAQKLYEEIRSNETPEGQSALDAMGHPAPVKICKCPIEMATFRYKGDPCPHCGDTIG